MDYLQYVHQELLSPQKCPTGSNLELARVTRFAVTEGINSSRAESVSRRVPDRVICQAPRNTVSRDVVLEDGEPERTVLKKHLRSKLFAWF